MDSEWNASMVRALLAGDPRAPVQVWERFAPVVRNIVRKAFGPTPDVDDLTQDVFISLFARLGTLRRPESLDSFVVSFAIRTVRREWRRRRGRNWMRLTDTGSVPDTELPAKASETRLELCRLNDLLDRLSLRERRVLLLRHLEELTLTEIALLTQLSLATVKRVVKRASVNLANLNREKGEPRRRVRTARRHRIIPQIVTTPTRWISVVGASPTGTCD